MANQPMEVKSNIWLEIDGEVVLSAWRIDLLQAIQQTGSISGAAELMNIPYRRAWEKIHQLEERLGLKLVETQVGGYGGGGAKLSLECLELIAKYALLTQGRDPRLQQRLEEILTTPAGAHNA